jgi:hypothetical protein
MTRNQKLALAGSLTLLVVLGLFAAYLLGTSSGDSTAASSTPGSSTPSSAPSSGPPSSQPPAPVTLAGIAPHSGPTASGWETDLALAFGGGVDAPGMTIAHGNGEGEYDVTFDGDVTVPRSVINQVDAEASRLLMQVQWDPATHELQIFQTAYLTQITSATADSSGGAGTITFLRRPVPATSHDCIEIDKPVPYTALFGLSKVTGFAELFEAGPMTVIARVPGKGLKTIKVKTAESTRQPFSAALELPLLDAPAEGYVAAYANSAKDGSLICLV